MVLWEIRHWSAQSRQSCTGQKEPSMHLRNVCPKAGARSDEVIRDDDHRFI
jgi:hypothetical protein